MTVGILIPIPREFVLTAAANTLAGAELYVYENLTTTPVTLYSDRACTTPAANPIVSVAGFFPRRYMASAQLLTLTLKNTAGSTIHSDDYVDPAIGASQAGAQLAAAEPSGRLTLESGVAVSTTDQTAKTTLYFTPYRGNRIALYDGVSDWTSYAFSQVSIAVPSTTDTNYDVFGYASAGALALELTAWTNATTRATALTTQDGVNVRSGATTRRFLGTIRTTGVSGQCEDSLAKRFVWNAQNRRPRPMRVIEGTDSWAYTTATIRQANNSSANQLAFVRGLNEDAVRADVQAVAANSSAGVAFYATIGLDSTTASSASSKWPAVNSPASNTNCSITPSYDGLPGLGYHYLAWLEYSQASGTTTWLGDVGGTLVQSGISGTVLA